MYSTPTTLNWRKSNIYLIIYWGRAWSNGNAVVDKSLYLSPQICYCSVMSENHDVSLSCIQWRASNRQGIPLVGVAWSSCSSIEIAGRRWRPTIQCAATCQHEVPEWLVNYKNKYVFTHQSVEILELWSEADGQTTSPTETVPVTNKH